MRTYDRGAPLIFIHVPKCGGRSVREQVQNWFGDNFLLHYANSRRGTLPAPQDIQTLHSPENPACVYGHFNRDRGFGVEASYPDACQFVTILRDPFEQVVSAYYWRRRPDVHKRRPAPEISLREHLNQTKSEMLLHFPREMTRDNYRDLIEEYFIEIGLLEELQTSLQRIATALGKPTIEDTGQRMNATPRDAQYENADDLREAFITRHALEYEVYDYVRARFAAAADPQDRSTT